MTCALQTGITAAAQHGGAALGVAAGCVAVIRRVQVAHVDRVVAARAPTRSGNFIAERIEFDTEVLVVGFGMALGARVTGALGRVGAAAAQHCGTALGMTSGCVAVVRLVEITHIDRTVAAGLLARADSRLTRAPVLGRVVLVVGFGMALGARVAGALGRIGAAAAHDPITANISASSVATGERASDLSMDLTDIDATVTPALLTRARLDGAEPAVLQGKMHIVDTGVRLGHSGLTMARLTRTTCLPRLP